MAPLLTKEANAFQASHPTVQVTVEGTSSGAGIAALRSGSTDVAASDVAISDPAFVDKALGTVAFAFVANPSSGVRDLTRSQVIAIFSGKIRNWKALGGNDVPIVIIGRDIGTGTRLVLEQKVAKTLIDTRIAKNADEVMSAVAQTPGALGYVATYFIRDKSDLVVRYNGIAPTPETIRDHTYRFSTVEHLYTRADASPLVRDFVSGVASDAPQLTWFGIY